MPTIRTRAAKGSALTHNEVDANFKRTARQVTATGSILVSDNRGTVEGNHASVAITLTLPTVAAAGAAEPGDFIVRVTNINSAICSVDGSTTETINGSTDAITLGQWESATFELDSAGAGWVTTSRVGDLGAVDGTFTGDLTGNVTGNVTGDVTGDVTGNADTVTTNANLTGDVTSVGNVTTVVTNANLTGDVTSVGNATTLTVAAITGQTATGTVTGTDELIINDGGAIRRTDLINLITGATDIGAAITDTDEIIISDAGNYRRTDMSRVANYIFPSGTLMLFQQTAAPTGWTKQATHNNKALRVVSGTASSGGTSPFSTVFGLTATDSHTLVEAEMPAHTHGTDVQVTTEPQYDTANARGGTQVSGRATSTSTGGGGGHSHNIELRVQYVDLIIASKD